VCDTVKGIRIKVVKKPRKQKKRSVKAKTVELLRQLISQQWLVDDNDEIVQYNSRRYALTNVKKAKTTSFKKKLLSV